jgi:shikimate kinase
VVATGGSVVYSERAMAHLRALGRVVHLALPLADLERRLADLAVRGVVALPGQDLAALYAERMPLYRRHAQQTLETRGLNQDQVVAGILAAARLAPVGSR